MLESIESGKLAERLKLPPANLPVRNHSAGAMYSSGVKTAQEASCWQSSDRDRNFRLRKVAQWILGQNFRFHRKFMKYAG